MMWFDGLIGDGWPPCFLEAAFVFNERLAGGEFGDRELMYFNHHQADI